MKDFEEKKQAIWARWERKIRIPLPQGFRDLMEKDYLDTFGGKEGLTDFEGGLEDFFNNDDMPPCDFINAEDLVNYYLFWFPLVKGSI